MTAFWELASIFRIEQPVLQKVLSDPRWQKYRDWYANLEQHIRAQDREVLDAQVPEPLCRSAFAHSQLQYFVREGVVHRNGPGYSLTALEAYDLIGGAGLEDVHEFGSLKLPPPTH